MKTTTMHTVWMVTLNPSNGSTDLSTQKAVCRAGSRWELEIGMRQRVVTMTHMESTLTSGKRSELFIGAT